MIKLDNVEVWGFEHAIRGCRAPYASYNRSDSHWENGGDDDIPRYVLGTEDLKLMHRLFGAGPEHRKYMRQIFVSMDITAPLYWWKQMDKYQIGVTTDSESTMHTLAKNPLTLDDFSVDGDFFIKENILDDPYMRGTDIACLMIGECEELRKKYVETKNPEYWRLLVQMLPEGYNQRRTVTMNYEVVATIIRQREHHRLHEWDDFIAELRTLPYLQEIMDGIDDGE